MMVTAGGGGAAALVAALPRLAATSPRRTIAAATPAVVHPARLMMYVMNTFMMLIMYIVKWIPKGWSGESDAPAGGGQPRKDSRGRGRALSRARVRRNRCGRHHETRRAHAR